jgi:hypothetical protein
MLGGGNAAVLRTDTVPIALRLAGKVAGARDERKQQDLGGGDRFRFRWKMNEAAVMSFAGSPPR